MPDPTDGGLTYEEIFNKLRGPMVGIEELRGLLDLVEQGHTLTEDSALRLIRSLAANRCAVPELQENARRAALEEAARMLIEHAAGHDEEAHLDKLRGLPRHSEDHRLAAVELREKAGKVLALFKEQK